MFAKHDYTESLAAYEATLHQGMSSPMMLLRMAFITEGLGDYAKTLCYLSLYQQQRPSPQVALKMNELATRHNLRGYEYDDWDFFLTYYQRYYIYMVAAFAVLALWMLGGMIRKKMRGNFVAGRHGLALSFFLGFMLLLFNVSLSDRKAVVTEDYTYFMDAPSAGSKVMRVVRKGHRVRITGEEDIWLRTNWEGKTAYVRRQNVWPVN
ncbi:MAG: SH3 domain-containing protein [Cytophagales bacterium]|nr:SH3 domain-containing protein [Cytophagales bacterium]